ncbi:MAG: nucleoside diphosphate kinase regulator [Proteobacteria bacterium]|nr:nucleoside diphosphate kinase regulator [Pseudomonadota bacterium]
MGTEPSIYITRIDADRIDALLEKTPDSALVGKEQLHNELQRATIVEPADIPANVVTMNSTVRFQIESTTREFTLKLVYPRDVDGSADKVSILAPIGSAILGLREGQSIVWPLPGGNTARVKVIKVVDQPERRGDYAS